MMDVGNLHLFSREEGGGKDAGKELLELLKNPYNDQVSLLLFQACTGY